jgi:hypothetical protein
LKKERVLSQYLSSQKFLVEYFFKLNREYGEQVSKCQKDELPMFPIELKEKNLEKKLIDLYVRSWFNQ